MNNLTFITPAPLPFIFRLKLLCVFLYVLKNVSLLRPIVFFTFSSVHLASLCNPSQRYHHQLIYHSSIASTLSWLQRLCRMRFYQTAYPLPSASRSICLHTPTWTDTKQTLPESQDLFGDAAVRGSPPRDIWGSSLIPGRDV